MGLAAVSLAALVLAVAVSSVSNINVGLLAIALAWAVGTQLGGIPLSEVLAGFPTSLFLTLVGVTLLFSQAQSNGTLECLTRPAVRLLSGNAGVMPMFFFALTALVSSIGPGNIAATALMAPMGMATAGRYGVSPFLMSIMVASGASAGSVSPIAPTGIVVNQIAATIGLSDTEWLFFLNNVVAHTVVAFCGYLVLGGWRLLRASPPREAAFTTGTDSILDKASERSGALTWQQQFTSAVIAAVVILVILYDLSVGMLALVGAVVLTFAKAADEKAAIRLMPWNAILMVCGVMTLVAIVEKTGGLALFTEFVAQFATPTNATGVTAFFTGVVSIYSSTTGVVLPTLLPIVPGLIERIGGGEPMALVSSMIVGGHLVDVSPLSTLGALCMAAAPAGTDARVLFNQLLAWGLSMSVVGAVLCWLAF